MWIVRVLAVSMTWLALPALSWEHLNFTSNLASGDTATRPRKILYFAQQNNNHHNPATFLNLVRQDFGENGLTFETSRDISSITLAGLSGFDGVYFYGNHNTFPLANQNELVSYIEGGGGMVGMHVFSYVVRNSPIVRNLLGAGFRGHHSPDLFTAVLIKSAADYPLNLAAHPSFPFTDGGTYASAPDHPILQGLETYSSVDEPFLNQNFNPDIILLSYRNDYDRWDEPYTWVREQGAGRVFYHANGHDNRTWSQPNFQNLMIRGTDWIAKKDEAGTHQTLFPPVLSPEGDTQLFSAIGSETASSLALYSVGFQSAAHGTQVPGNNETLQFVLNNVTDHAIASGGKVAFQAGVHDGASTATALFAGHPRYPLLLAGGGTNAEIFESGFRYQATQALPFQMNAAGTVLFAAGIEDVAGQNQKSGFAITSGGSTSPLILEGTPFVSLPNHTVLQLDLDSFTISDSSEAALIADLQDNNLVTKSHLLVGGTAPLQSWLISGASLESLSPGTSVHQFESVLQLHEGHLFFSATIQGPGVSPANDRLIATTTANGEITPLLREGDTIAGEIVTLPAPSIHFAGRGNRLVITGQSSSGHHILLELSPGRSPHILLREQTPLNIAGNQWTIDALNTESLMVSEDHLMIQALLRKDDTTAQSLLHLRPGIIHPVMMEGWTVETSSGQISVDQIACSPSSNPGSGLNQNGAVTFLVSQGSTQAVVTIENLEDLDRDGLPDVLEVAFGGDPLSPSPQTLPGAPAIHPSDTGGFELIFWQHQNPSGPLLYQIQVSENLIDWEDTFPIITPDLDQTDVAESYTRMKADLPVTATPRFYRCAF